MADVHAIGLLGMQRDMARLQSVSTNLANATTPGYKREIHTAAPIVPSLSFASIVDDGVLEASNLLAQPTASGAMHASVLRDLRPGALKSTGQALDVALSGAGYFEVQTPQGVAYTRDGSWHVDPQGRLVNSRGEAVMGQGGEIVLNQPDPMIDSAGRIFVKGADGRREIHAVAQLKVVAFDDPQNLVRMGGGLWSSEQMPRTMAEAEISVRQGYMENSNVESMREMVHLMETMRHFESLQKAVVNYDDMVGLAVRKLGELN